MKAQCEKPWWERRNVRQTRVTAGQQRESCAAVQVKGQANYWVVIEKENCEACGQRMQGGGGEHGQEIALQIQGLDSAACADAGPFCRWIPRVSDG